MERGGERPDENDGPDAENPESWYFDLPSGAWERQEAKNRELRQRVLNNLDEAPAKVDPFARKREPEEKRGGMFGLGKKKDEADDSRETPGGTFRLSRGGGTAGFGALPAPNSTDDDGDDWSTEPELPVPLRPRAVHEPISPALQRGYDPGPEKDEEKPVSHWDDAFGGPGEDGGGLTAMDEWAKRPVERSEPRKLFALRPVAPIENADEAPAAKTAEPVADVPQPVAPDVLAPPTLGFARRSQEEHDEADEAPKGERWNEMFDSAETSGSGGLSAMAEWAKHKDGEPREIPEEFLQPFDWETEDVSGAPVVDAAPGAGVAGEWAPEESETAQAAWDLALEMPAHDASAAVTNAEDDGDGAWMGAEDEPPSPELEVARLDDDEQWGTPEDVSEGAAAGDLPVGGDFDTTVERPAALHTEGDDDLFGEIFGKPGRGAAGPADVAPVGRDEGKRRGLGRLFGRKRREAPPEAAASEEPIAAVSEWAPAEATTDAGMTDADDFRTVAPVAGFEVEFDDDASAGVTWEPVSEDEPSSAAGDIFGFAAEREPAQGGWSWTDAPEAESAKDDVPAIAGKDAATEFSEALAALQRADDVEDANDAAEVALDEPAWPVEPDEADVSPEPASALWSWQEEGESVPAEAPFGATLAEADVEEGAFAATGVAEIEEKPSALWSWQGALSDDGEVEAANDALEPQDAWNDESPAPPWDEVGETASAAAIEGPEPSVAEWDAKPVTEAPEADTVEASSFAWEAAESESPVIDDAPSVEAPSFAWGAAESDAPFVDDAPGVEAPSFAWGATEGEAPVIDDAPSVEAASFAWGVAESDAAVVDDAPSVDAPSFAWEAAEETPSPAWGASGDVANDDDGWDPEPFEASIFAAESGTASSTETSMPEAELGWIPSDVDADETPNVAAEPVAALDDEATAAWWEPEDEIAADDVAEIADGETAAADFVRAVENRWAVPTVEDWRAGDVSREGMDDSATTPPVDAADPWAGVFDSESDFEAPVVAEGAAPAVAPDADDDPWAAFMSSREEKAFIQEAITHDDPPSWQAQDAGDADAEDQVFELGAPAPEAPDSWADTERAAELEHDSAEAEDPWAAIAAASGYDSVSPSGSAVYRETAHESDIVASLATQMADAEDEGDAWAQFETSASASAPNAPYVASTQDEGDVVLRAFEQHAAADDDAEEWGAEPATPDEPGAFAALLGEDAEELVSEIDPMLETRAFQRLQGWAPQRPSHTPSDPANAPWEALEDEEEFHDPTAPLPWRGRSDEVLPPPPWNSDGEPSRSDDGGGAVAPASGHSRTKTLVRELVETGLLALLVFLAVRASFQNFKVDGSSMNPTLQNGEFLIVNKIVYSEVNVDKLANFVPFLDPGNQPERNVFHGPERGDIVVLVDPHKTDTDLIKRIIGLPGETVEIADGHVYINDHLLEEPYIKTAWHDNKPPVVLPDGMYFVMGDNRDNSLDSRSSQVGLIPKDLIIGKAMLSYWPTSKFGLAPNEAGNISLKDGPPRLTAERIESAGR